MQRVTEVDPRGDHQYSNDSSTWPDVEGGGEPLSVRIDLRFTAGNMK